jgi:hypothetical protein
MIAMKESNASRRQFLTSSAAGVAAVLAAPAVHTLAQTNSKTIVGEGDYQYEVEHMWGELPSKFNWQTTHNVAVDKNQNVYVIHEGRHNQKDHPSIFVFDHEGKFIRAFGSQFQGGGHGLEVRDEGDEEFLYVCGYQEVKAFAKLRLNGDIIWWKNAPMESGVYIPGEDRTKVKNWGTDRFLPTNFAFLDDGGFLLADGYGSFYIHKYDKDANWVSHFGGPGDGEGTFKTPHGIWIDRRGDQPRIVVCDRAHHTLQVLTMDGQHIKTLTGYGLPANIDTLGDLMLVPELHARVTLLDKDFEVVARLGADVQRVTKTVKGVRDDEAKWLDGKFVHPHDACFADGGDIFVAEWVRTGRISKLKKLS